MSEEIRMCPALSQNNTLPQACLMDQCEGWDKKIGCVQIAWMKAQVEQWEIDKQPEVEIPPSDKEDIGIC